MDFKVDLEEGSGGGGGDGDAGWVESRTILGQVCFVYNLYVTVIFVYTTQKIYIFKKTLFLRMSHKEVSKQVEVAVKLPPSPACSFFFTFFLK